MKLYILRKILLFSRMSSQNKYKKESKRKGMFVYKQILRYGRMTKPRKLYLNIIKLEIKKTIIAYMQWFPQRLYPHLEKGTHDKLHIAALWKPITIERMGT